MVEDKIKRFKAGETIIRKDEEASCAYMILSGKVCVFIEEGSREITLAELENGAIFGETAIFEGGLYNANVKAVEDCTILVITPESMTEMLENSDPIVRALLEMLIERQKATNEALVRSETREFMDIVLV